MPKIPLKHKSDNDVQEMSDSDHNYLAYLAGLELETASGTYSESVLGSLGKTNQTDDLSIGTLTDTGRLSGDVGDKELMVQATLLSQQQTLLYINKMLHIVNPLISVILYINTK